MDVVVPAAAAEARPALDSASTTVLAPPRHAVALNVSGHPALLHLVHHGAFMPFVVEELLRSHGSAPDAADDQPRVGVLQCVSVVRTSASSTLELQEEVSALLRLEHPAQVKRSRNDQDTEVHWCRVLGDKESQLTFRNTVQLPCGSHTEAERQWLGALSCVYAVATTLWMVVKSPGVADEAIAAQMAQLGHEQARVLLAGDVRTVGVLEPLDLSPALCDEQAGWVPDAAMLELAQLAMPFEGHPYLPSVAELAGADGETDVLDLLLYGENGGRSWADVPLSQRLHCSAEVRGVWGRRGGDGRMMRLLQIVEIEQLRARLALRMVRGLIHNLDQLSWWAHRESRLRDAAARFGEPASAGSNSAIAVVRRVMQHLLPVAYTWSVDSAGLVGEVTEANSRRWAQNSAWTAVNPSSELQVLGGGDGGSGIHAAFADAREAPLRMPPHRCSLLRGSFFQCWRSLVSSVLDPESERSPTLAMSWWSWGRALGMLSWPSPVGVDEETVLDDLASWQTLGSACDALFVSMVSCIVQAGAAGDPFSVSPSALSPSSWPTAGRPDASLDAEHGVCDADGACAVDGVGKDVLAGGVPLARGSDRWDCATVDTAAGAQPWVHVASGTRLHLDVRGLGVLVALEPGEGDAVGLAVGMARLLRACNLPGSPWSHAVGDAWQNDGGDGSGSTLSEVHAELAVMSRFGHALPSPLMLSLVEAGDRGAENEDGRCRTMVALPKGRPVFVADIPYMSQLSHLLVDGLMPIVGTMLARWGRIRHDAVLLLNVGSDLALQSAQNLRTWWTALDTVAMLLHAVFEVGGVHALPGLVLQSVVERDSGSAPPRRCAMRESAPIVLEANEATFLGADLRQSIAVLSRGGDAESAPPLRKADLVGAWRQVEPPHRASSVRLVADVLCSQRRVLDALRAAAPRRLRELHGRVERVQEPSMPIDQGRDVMAPLPDGGSSSQEPSEDAEALDEAEAAVSRPSWMSPSCHRLCMPFLRPDLWPSRAGTRPDVGEVQDDGMVTGWSRRATRHLFFVLPHQQHRGMSPEARRGGFAAALDETARAAGLWARACAVCMSPGPGVNGTWGQDQRSPDAAAALGAVAYALADRSLAARSGAGWVAGAEAGEVGEVLSEYAMLAAEEAVQASEQGAREAWGGDWLPLASHCVVLPGCAVSVAAREGLLGESARAEAEAQASLLGASPADYCRTVECRVGPADPSASGAAGAAGAMELAAKLAWLESPVHVSVSSPDLERVPMALQQYMWRRTLALFVAPGQVTAHAALMPAGSVLVQAVPRGHLRAASAHGALALAGGVHVVTLRHGDDSLDSGSTADTSQGPDVAVTARDLREGQLRWGLRASLLLSLATDLDGGCVGERLAALVELGGGPEEEDSANLVLGGGLRARGVGWPWMSGLDPTATPSSVIGGELQGSGWVRFQFPRHLEAL